MKKIILLFIFFLCAKSFAQTNGITYQAVILNPNGVKTSDLNNSNLPLASKDICMLFKFVDEFSNVEYQEIIRTKTDPYGMVNLIIGTGTQTSGYATSFSKISWDSVDKSLVVGINVTGDCSSFTEISNQPFNYVPFAYSAINTVNVTGVVAVENGGTNAITVLGAKTNLGLESVDNTSDLNKPISNATKVALDLKEDGSNKSTSIITDGNSDIKFPSVKSVKTYVDSSISSNGIALTTEINRAITAENTIASNLVSETTRATLAETTLTANLATETTRATTAEATKEDAVNKSTDGTFATNSDVKFPTEKATKTYVDGTAATASTALATEINRATTAEGVLATSITTEASTRGTADATLTMNFNAEVLRASVAETALGTNLALKADLASPTFTGTVSGIDKTMVGLENVDNTTDLLKPVSTPTQTALGLKADLASPTFTGTVSGIDKTMVGLANVDNTADADKPVSTDTQTALDLKANLASPTFTGVPLTPTAVEGTNTTQVATTEFVGNAVTNKFVDLTTNQIIKGVKTFDDGIKTIKIDASASLDQSNTNSNAGAGGSFQWQSFTANSTGILSAVEWQMSNPTYPYGTSANVTVKIYQGEGVSGSLLGTAVSLTPSDGTNSYINFNLDSQNINTVSGSVYTIELTTPSVQIGWLNLNTSNSYSLGRGSNDPNWDYIFKTYVKGISEDSYLTSGDSENALALKADLVSPTFMGTPTLPSGTIGVTQTFGDNSTKLATTAFVKAEAITEVTDEFAATASQTSFTLTQAPAAKSKVKMYVNGIRISNTAYSWVENNLTYISVNNGGYNLSASDRIQFDYFY